MKLEDIQILEADLPPYQITTTPSKVTLSFLSQLLNNPDFIQEITDISEEYGIRKPSLLDAFENQREDVFAFYDFMKGSFDGLMFRFNLPNGYRFRLFLLIVFRSFIDIPEDEEPDIVYLSNPSDIAEYTKDLEEEIERVSAIAFGSTCTKKELIDWINKNWADIKKDMDESLPTRPKLGKVYKNVTIAQEAYELRKEGKSYVEVSDILMEKHPDNQSVCDVGWLKNLVTRHIQKTKKFSSQFPPLTD